MLLKVNFYVSSFSLLFVFCDFFFWNLIFARKRRNHALVLHFDYSLRNQFSHLDLHGPIRDSVNDDALHGLLYFLLESNWLNFPNHEFHCDYGKFTQLGQQHLLPPCLCNPPFALVPNVLLWKNVFLDSCFSRHDYSNCERHENVLNYSLNLCLWLCECFLCDWLKWHPWFYTFYRKQYSQNSGICLVKPYWRFYFR